LVGGISTCGAKGIAKAEEKFSHLRVVIEFTTLVEVDVFVRALRRVVLEEVSEPMNWGCFGHTSIAMLHAREMVRDEDPRGFPIEAEVVLGAKSIFGSGAGEGEVYRESLVRLGSGASAVGACRFLGLFGADASGAVI
jgi:hypothetical protein